MSWIHKEIEHASKYEYQSLASSFKDWTKNFHDNIFMIHLIILHNIHEYLQMLRGWLRTLHYEFGKMFPNILRDQVRETFNTTKD